MERVDFHTLSRAAQERFVSSVRGSLKPSPILQTKVRSREPLLWGSVIAVSIAALVATFAYGFGSLEKRAAWHALTVAPIWVLAVAALVYAIARLRVFRMREGALPFERGVYVFPMSVVDAQTSSIKVIPLGEVQDETRGEQVELVTAEGERFSFSFADPREAEAARRALEEARREAEQLRGASDPRITLMFERDPLQAPRIVNPLGPKSSLSQRMPAWTQRAWVLALAVGLVVGLSLRVGRNLASDARRFARANAASDVASYRAYLANTGRHHDEVTRVLLPRAELREAQQAGTVAAVEQYMASHPNSAIDAEVKAAHRKALLDELEVAKKAGTLPELHAFARRHPGHGLDDELRAAIHAVFARALDAHRKQAPNAPPEVRAFVERLLVYTEKRAQEGSGPVSVLIRFHRKPSATLRKADKMVSEHHWFVGERSYPSRYFDAAHALPREQALGKALAARLHDALSPTVFTFEVGEPITDLENTLPTLSAPTLVISHGAEWPHTFDGSITKPRGIWINVTIPFSAVFAIPKDHKPLRFEQELVEMIPKTIIEAEGQTPAPDGSPSLEERLYGAMAKDAFTQFEQKYMGSFVETRKLALQH